MNTTTRCLSLILLFLICSSVQLRSNLKPYYYNSAIAQEEDFDGEEESLFDDGEDDADFSEDDPDEKFGDFDVEDDSTDFMDFNEDELEQANSKVKDESDSDFDEFEKEAEVVEESTPIATEPEEEFQVETEIEDELQPAVEQPTQITEPTQISEPSESFVSVDEAKSFNTEYEDQLFNIYQKYYNFPVSGSDWDSLTGDRKSEIYVIQRGDTLWDISATFFGDGGYWPKIWSVNGRITNPHLIEVGNNILFNLGNINSPPTFTVSDEGIVPAADGGLAESIAKSNLVASTGPVRIPKSKIRRRPVMKNLPASLPAWARAQKNPPMSFNVVSTGFKSSRSVNIPVTHLIKQESMATSGKVIEAEAGERFATAGQYIYVDFDGSPNSQRYLAAKLVGKTKPELASGKIAGPNGKVYEIQGEISIRDDFSSDGKQLYRAYVESAFSPIGKGSILLNQNLIRVNIKKSGDYNLTPGQIIGGSMLKGSRLLSDGMFAFINKGASDGMEVDDKVMFISQRKVRKSSTRVKGQLFKVGEGQVVDVSSDVSTVLVTKAYREIYVGDYIGEPDFNLINKAGKSNFSSSGSKVSGDGFGDDDFADDSGGDDSTFDASEDLDFEDDATDEGGDDDTFDDADDFGDNDDFEDAGSDDDFGGDDDFGEGGSGDDFEDDGSSSDEFDEEF